MARPVFRVLPLVVVAAVLSAQDGTSPKASEQDYAAHVKLGHLSIGAEYLGHSFSSGREMFIAKDYLVLEVALFPAKGERLSVAASQFSLRVNGRKQVVGSQAPQFVAASLKDPELRSGLHPVAALGPVVLGAPPPTERFPGDPNGRTAPPPPQLPTDDHGGADKAPPVKPEELIIQAALPEGESRKPVSGFVYFPYRGKLGHIRSLELIYASPAGDATLSLQ